MKNYKKIEKLLGEINIDADLEGEEITSFDELREHLEDNNSFDIEIIYYSKAMEYLSENDDSLMESLSLAHDMGYTANNINSALLASLLATQEVRSDFAELEDKITELLED